MKATLRFRYGTPDTLQIGEIPKPSPEANEILVKVYTSTVNRTDCAVLTGWPLAIRVFTGLSKPKNPVTGTDFAGQVEAIGSAVKNFHVGDRVWGFYDNGLGSHAEYLCIAEDQNVLKIPALFNYSEAVACAEGGHYAVNFLNKIHIQAEHKVLINGATGAIGSAAIQLVKSLGAQVTATCAGTHLELIQSLGADRVIDYTVQDFTQLEEKFDFVLDAVGKSTFFKCKRILGNKGIYISSELGPWWQNIWLALFGPLLGGKKVVFPVPLDIKKSMTTILQLSEKGHFRPLIDRSYPLGQIAKAFTYVASGQKIGNVIINVAEEV